MVANLKYRVNLIEILSPFFIHFITKKTWIAFLTWELKEKVGIKGVKTSNLDENFKTEQDISNLIIWFWINMFDLVFTLRPPTFQNITSCTNFWRFHLKSISHLIRSHMSMCALVKENVFWTLFLGKFNLNLVHQIWNMHAGSIFWLY